METLVATVLIVIVFLVASLVLNNLFRNEMKRDARIESYLNMLQYQWQQKTINGPYVEAWGDWEIIIQEESQYSSAWVLKATNQKTQKSIKQYLSDAPRAN